MKKILFLALASLLITGCWETQKGEKLGSIIKLAKEGLMCKTWEAQLIRGGMNGGSGGFGVKPFDFTIEGDVLLEKVKLAMDSQKEVKIKYHKEAATFCRTETAWNYFLDDVEIIK